MALLGLRFLHFLSMAIWIAAALQLTSRLRALSADPSRDGAAFQASSGATGPLGHVAAVGSLATGVAMILQLGGMGAVPWPIHLSLLLGLGMWVLLGLAERGYRSVHGAIAGGEADREALGGRLRTSRLLTIGFHVSWTLVLGLMVFRNVIA